MELEGTSPLDPIRSQMNPVHILTPYFVKIGFNIMLSTTAVVQAALTRNNLDPIRSPNPVHILTPYFVKINVKLSLCFN